MDAIRNKIRDLIEDNLKSTVDIFEFISSKIFTLTEPNVDSTTIKVYKNGSLVSSSNYTFDSTNSKLTISGSYSVAVNDIIEITYSAYIKYSTTEIDGYIRSAMVYISAEKYMDFVDRCGTIFPTPSESQENLIALVASILIKKSIKSYRTSEINIVFGEDSSIEEKIRKAVSKFKSKYGTIEFHNLNNALLVEEELDE